MVLKTRSEALDAVARQSLKLDENDMDTPSSVLGKRDRSMAEPSNIESSTQFVEEKRSREDTPATTLAAHLAVVHAHAQWWSPDLKPKIEVSQCSVVEGVDGATSAWVADERNRISRQELTPVAEDVRAESVDAGKLRGPEAWEKFDLSPRMRRAKYKNKLRRLDGYWLGKWWMGGGVLKHV